jgi:hypothetical protein
LPRPGGPTAKLQPSPEGLGINRENDPSAIGAAPVSFHHILGSQGMRAAPTALGSSRSIIDDLYTRWAELKAKSL